MQREDDHVQQMRSLQDAFDQVIPIWDRHIELVQNQLEQAISSLTTHFGGLIERLNSTMSASRAACGDGQAGGLIKNVRESLETSELQLREILNSLQRTLPQKRRMLAQIEYLTSFAGELTEMGTLVAQVATQTRMLAINAAIEAARSGEAGRGFAVVAAEVKRLSEQSRQAGDRISERVGLIQNTLDGAYALVKETLHEDDLAVQESAQAVEGVLGCMRQVTGAMESTSSILRDEASTMQTQISEMLVALQFQDRVNQILSAVRVNFGELRALLRVGPMGLPQVDKEALLQKMKTHYTTGEQRITHEGAAEDALSPGELTFF